MAVQAAPAPPLPRPGRRGEILGLPARSHTGPRHQAAGSRQQTAGSRQLQTAVQWLPVDNNAAVLALLQTTDIPLGVDVGLALLQRTPGQAWQRTGGRQT